MLREPVLTTKLTMCQDALQGNINTRQWLLGSTCPAQASNNKLNHKKSTNVGAQTQILGLHTDSSGGMNR